MRRVGVERVGGGLEGWVDMVRSLGGPPVWGLDLASAEREWHRGLVLGEAWGYPMGRTEHIQCRLFCSFFA